MNASEPVGLGEYEATEEAYRQLKRGQVLNPHGRGGRLAAAARAHQNAALEVLVAVMASERSTDEARVRAAEVILRAGAGKL
jgi:hypothetical protein